MDDRPPISTIVAIVSWRGRMAMLLERHVLICGCRDEWAEELVGYCERVGTEIIKRWPKVSFGNLESIVARKWDREHK